MLGRIRPMPQASRLPIGEGRKIRRARNAVRRYSVKLAWPGLSAEKRAVLQARYERARAKLLHSVLVGGL